MIRCKILASSIYLLFYRLCTGYLCIANGVVLTYLEKSPFLIFSFSDSVLSSYWELILYLLIPTCIGHFFEKYCHGWNLQKTMYESQTSFCLDMLGSLINWESSLKFDACGRSVQVNSYYPFIYQPSHLTAGGYQVTEAWYRIHKSILTAHNCLLVLRVFEIGDLWISKRISYITFPRIEQMLTGL